MLKNILFPLIIIEDGGFHPKDEGMTMALTKKFLKSKPICKVRFKLPKEAVDSAQTVHLVGDFNDWELGATPLKGNKDGTFAVQLDLDTGRDYQFRYVIDGEIWVNDWEADRYEFNPAGNCENSVLVLS